ncbi:MAG: hypothetical protein IRY97_08550 [Thermomicrobiaceae bacterium]|nr:hypothetical protein [Thermomicrobiaceae bacterium]
MTIREPKDALSDGKRNNAVASDSLVATRLPAGRVGADPGHRPQRPARARAHHHPAPRQPPERALHWRAIPRGRGGLVAAALARAAYDARIFIFCFAAVTTAILVVTLANWSTFTADGVPWVWLVTYVVDPLLVPVVVTATGIWRPDRPRRHRWSPLFLGMAAALGSVGLLLLLWPGAAIALWPWTMTPLLARLYASFFLGYALGGLLCAWEPRPSATLAVRVSAALLGLLVLVASAPHLDRFGSTRDVVVWFAAFAALGLAFLSTLVPVPLGSAGAPGALEPPPGAATPPGDGR